MAQENNIRKELREIRDLLNLLGKRIDKIEQTHGTSPQSELLPLADSTVASQHSLPVANPIPMATPPESPQETVVPESTQPTPINPTRSDSAPARKEEPSPEVPPKLQPTQPQEQLVNFIENQGIVTQPSRPTTRSSIPSEPEKVNSFSLESWIGGRVFTWAGGVLLILSTAFFVVWSWRHLDLPAWVRVLMLHAGGLAIIGCATWFKQRLLKLHSEVLYGVGIFSLYASGLAMTHLYSLGEPNHELLGFADLAMITSIAIAISLRNKSMGIILLGACGGYLTPFVTLQGSDPIITFIYLAFLNVALLVSAHLGKWSFLTYISWIMTALIFLPAVLGLPVVNDVQIFDSPLQGICLLTLHAGIFLAAITIPCLVFRNRSTPADNSILVANCIAYIAGFALLSDLPIRNLSYVCFGLMAIHFVIFVLASQRLDLQDRLGRVNLALSSLLLTLGLTIWFSNQPGVWSILWVLEGLAFALIGFVYRDRQLLITASIAFGLTLFRASTEPSMFETSVSDQWLDPRSMKWLFYAVIIGISGSGYWWMPRKRGILTTETQANALVIKRFAESLLGVANLLFLIAGIIQFRDSNPLLLTFCALDVGALWYAAFAFKLAGLRKYATVLSIPLILFACLLTTAQLSNLQGNWTVTARVGLLTTALILLVAGLQYWRADSSGFSQGERNLHYLLTFTGHLGVIALLTAETIYLFGGNSLIHNANGLTLCLSLWIIYGLALIQIGRQAKYGFMTVMGMGAFLITAMLTGLRIPFVAFDGLNSHWSLLSLGSYSFVASVLIGFGWRYWQVHHELSDETENSTHFFLTVAGHFILVGTLTCQIAYMLGGELTDPRTLTFCTLLWTLYATVLSRVGDSIDYGLMKQTGLALILLAGFAGLVQFSSFFVSSDHDYWSIWSRVTYGALGGTLIGFGLHYWSEHQKSPDTNPRSTDGILTVLGHLIMLLLLTTEVRNFFAAETNPGTPIVSATYSVTWCIYAAAMVTCGFWFRYPLPRFIGIGLIGLVLSKVFLFDLARYHLIVRVIALMILGLLLLGTSLLYQKFRSRIEPT